MRFLKPMKHQQKSENHRGYIALVSLLMISAVALGIALVVAPLSISEAQMSLSVKKGNEARYVAEACAENALEMIKDSPAYSGETLSILGGSCTISVSTAGNDWTVISVAEKDNYSKTIEIQLTRLSSITLNSWQEL